MSLISLDLMHSIYPNFVFSLSISQSLSISYDLYIFLELSCDLCYNFIQDISQISCSF